MGRSHSHEGIPGRDERAAPPSRFALGAGVNLLFVLVEAVLGVVAGSVALLADAAHNLGDSAGLFLAWGAARLSRRRPSGERTYGFRKATILAPLVNASLLLVVTGGIAWESAKRLASPTPVRFELVALVAAAGILVNGLSALLFLRTRHRDLNARAAFLHLAADAGVSFAVLAGGLVIRFTGLSWVDPALGLVVSAVILREAFGLLREATHLALDGAPSHVDFGATRRYLTSLPGVSAVHDLHIWAISSTEAALTAHLVLDASGWPDERLREVSLALHERFGIQHATLQVEPELATSCHLEAVCAPDGAVRSEAPSVRPL